MNNSSHIYFINLLQSAMMNGLIPILPLFAVDLGMSKSLVGFYLATTYIMLFIGNFISGYIIDKIKNIKLLLIFSTTLFSFFIILHNFISNQLQLFLFTSLLWLIAGAQSVILNTIQGRRSNTNNSGKNYAKLSITSVLGIVLGGLLIGILLRFFQMKTMFLFLGSVSAFTILGSLYLKENTNVTIERESFFSFNKKIIHSPGHSLFFVSAIMISIVNYILLLSLSIMMKEHGYEYFKISLIIAGGAILTIPGIFLFGKYSDLKGKKPFMISSYALYILGFIFLFNPLGIIFFIIAAFSRSMAVFSKNPISLAYIKEIATEKNLAKALSYFGSTIWVGGIIGFSFAGIMIDNLGYHKTFYIAVVIIVLSIAMLIASFKFKSEKI